MGGTLAFLFPHSFPLSIFQQEIGFMPEKEIGHLGLHPSTRAFLSPCISCPGLAPSTENFSTPHTFFPTLSLGPLFPGAHQCQTGAVGWALGTSKNSCLNQALLWLAVAVSGELSGRNLGHLPLGSGPAYLARDWAGPYLLTLTCLPPGLRPPLRAVSGPGPLRVSSMAKKRAWTSTLTPHT